MSLDNSAVVPALPTGGYQIEQSLRFNDNDSAYLSRTPSSSATNRKKWTFSAWVKRNNISFSTSTYLFSTANNGIGLGNGDYIFVTRNGVDSVETSAKLRDTASWYHIVIAVDTTLGSASDRVKIYINGELQSTNGGNPFSQNYDTEINHTTKHAVGRSEIHSGRYADVYMAEIHEIDGQQLDPTYFGETDEDYGHWKPIKYTGSYGTNGFYLDFDGTYYNDKSGNGNNFTANNLSSYDVVPDSPTNNFATFNPLDTNATLAEGNLWAKDLGTYTDVPATIGMTSGKWYAEFYNKDSQTSLCGITGLGNNGMNHSEVDSLRTVYEDNGYIYREGTGVSNTNTGTTHGTGDIIGVTLDVDGGTIAFYKNGTLVNSTTNSVYSSNEWKFYVGVADNADWIANFGQDSSFAGNKTAQGNTDGNGIGDFYYTPPSGYLALCTANLPDPDVIPSEHFNTVLYTGNGSTQSITGVGFQPDFVWGKNRVEGQYHSLMDAVRGTNSLLHSNTTSAEIASGSNAITSFDSDGFSLGSWYEYNKSGQAYVAWNWKANGSGVSNTNGSITSTVSANQDAGFSIVNFTGTGSNGTVGHGLSQAPEMMIFKRRDSGSSNWITYHKGIGNGYNLFLNLANAKDTDGALYWQSTDPTSTVFTAGGYSQLNYSGSDTIGYCFHSVDGFSKVGSYTGNGSSDGTFVYTGFRPAFVMQKRIDSGGGWHMFDNERSAPYNEITVRLEADNADAENTGGPPDTDLLSNGFKWRTSFDNINVSGGDYIYIAFAENPFKYTNAR